MKTGQAIQEQLRQQEKEPQVVDDMPFIDINIPGVEDSSDSPITDDPKIGWKPATKADHSSLKGKI